MQSFGVKHDDVRRALLRKKLKLSFVLSCLMGLSWLFAFLAVDRRSPTMSYLFAILNSLQGIWILVDNTLLDVDVRRRLAEIICCLDRRFLDPSKKSQVSPLVGTSPQSLGHEPRASVHFYPDAHRNEPMVMLNKRSSLSLNSPSTRTSDLSLSPRSSAYISPISSSLLQILEQSPAADNNSRSTSAVPTAAIGLQLHKFFESTDLTAQRRRTMELMDTLDSSRDSSHFDSLVKSSGLSQQEIEEAMEIPEEILFNDINPEDLVFTETGFSVSIAGMFDATPTPDDPKGDVLNQSRASMREYQLAGPQFFDDSQVVGTVCPDDVTVGMNVSSPDGSDDANPLSAFDATDEDVNMLGSELPEGAFFSPAAAIRAVETNLARKNPVSD